MKNILKGLTVLLLSISISSCAVKKKIIDNNTVIIDDDTNQNTFTEIIQDSLFNETILDSILLTEDTLLLKQEYTIALILPLFADSINTIWQESSKSNLEDFYFPDKSIEALGFLEGALLALEELDLNSKINLKVYDNTMSYQKTKKIIQELENEDIDFIIGPIKKANIQQVSTFAESKNILMVSPFSPSKIASNNYSKYLMLEPSIDLHFKTISDYIAKNFTNSHIKVIYPNTNLGQHHALTLQNFIIKSNDSLEVEDKVSYALIEVESKTNDRKKFKIVDYLDADEKNIVIITAFNEGFVHSMLTMLNTQLKDFDITVFGMPNWKESNTLRLEYFNKLNVHYTDSKWLDKSEDKTKEFISTYRDRYKSYPKEISFLGYDLFSLLPTYIDNYGLSISDNIVFKEFNGLLNNYEFTTIINENNEIIRIENKNLHIISYKDFKLHLEE